MNTKRFIYPRQTCESSDPSKESISFRAGAKYCERTQKCATATSERLGQLSIICVCVRRIHIEPKLGLGVKEKKSE